MRTLNATRTVAALAALALASVLLAPTGASIDPYKEKRLEVGPCTATYNPSPYSWETYHAVCGVEGTEVLEAGAGSGFAGSYCYVEVLSTVTHDPCSRHDEPPEH